MIEANELRIGNSVYDTRTVGDRAGLPKVRNHTTITLIEERKYVSGVYTYLDPIELTPDVLLACGFEKHENSNEFWNHWVLPNNWYISEALHNEPSAGVRVGICYWSDIYIAVKNLHHLQNLYFALTGKELIYNLEKK